MSLSEENEFLRTAVQAARNAGDYLLRNLGTLSKKDIGLKQTADFVTRVDKESEQLIISIIKEKFSEHSFLAEESARETTDTYLWIIDPLDGTTNYIHEYPAFSVSIALKYKEELILGAVFDPLKDELFTTEKGKGVWLNDKSVHVSDVTDIENSLITTGFPFRKKELIDKYLRLFQNVFMQVSDVRRAGSAALDLAYLASGRCDGFFEIGLSPWDVAAGSLMIQEAGGIVTDFSGGSDYLTTGNIVAGTPVTHEKILQEVKKVFARIIDR